jgi:hypothetical protein
MGIFEMLKKAFILICKKITYQQILASLILCLLILTYFIWPSIYGLFQKKLNFSLDLPENTIPFLIVEKDEKNLQNNILYLAFWDLEQGKINRDDTNPICEITGDINQIFWTGTKQIFLSPLNDRGTITIVNQDPSYQILVKATTKENQSIIKPSFDGRKVYELSVDSTSGILKLKYLSGKKEISIESSGIAKYPDYKLVKPIFFIPENSNPVIYCFFELKSKPKMGLGIMVGTLEKKSIIWNIWKEYNESINLDAFTSCNFYYDEIVMSNAKTLHINQFTTSNEIRDLSSANNYLSMFHQYLFGLEGSMGYMNRQGVNLTEQEVEPPSLQVFDDYLLLNWVPNFISSKEFYIKQVIALKDKKTIGRIEVMGEKIRLFQGSMLVSEEIGDKRFLSSQWIFPNR